jgi:glutathione S-transferase
MAITLHRHPLSGHSHRAHLALSLLGLPFTLADVDLMKGAHKTADFRKLHPFGQVPVLDDDGTTIWDSNAILVYLAAKYDRDGVWIPRDALGQARVQAWLSVAAGPIAFGPAAARLITVFGAKYSPEDTIGRAHALLQVMEGELAKGRFLVGDRATFADVAAYSYIANAPEGNVNLAEYPQVREWLARIEALPGFVPFQQTKAGLRA